jgi:hypothetical protein
MARLVVLCSLVFLFYLSKTLACSDGSDPSCPLSISGTPPWASSTYYDSLLTVGACASNASHCASIFKGFFAGGLPCTAVPTVVPPPSFVATATFAFIFGVLSLLAPCAPTCICGKRTPLFAIILGVTLHVILFAAATQSLTSLVSEVDATSVTWSKADMAVVLAEFTSIHTPSNELLLKTSFSAPFTLVDIVGGIATGPVRSKQCLSMLSCNTHGLSL